MQEWDKDKFIDKDIYLAMKRVTAGIAREIVDTSKTAGEASYRLTDWFYGRNVQGANRHCQSTPRIEATHPECRVLSLAERDQEVGQRICSSTTKRTDAKRHRQSG